MPTYTKSLTIFPVCATLTPNHYNRVATKAAKENRAMHLYYFNGTKEAPLPVDAVVGRPFRTAGMTVNVDLRKNKAIVVCDNGKRLEYDMIPGTTKEIIDFTALLAEFKANKLQS